MYEKKWKPFPTPPKQVNKYPPKEPKIPRWIHWLLLTVVGILIAVSALVLTAVYHEYVGPPAPKIRIVPK